TCSMTENRPLYLVPKASFAYVCRGAGISARPNRRQASASRICDGSLYIALRLIRVIPASRLPCPAESRIILQDGFGACSVRFPQTAVSMLPPCLCLSPAGPVRQPFQQSGAPGYLLFLTEQAARPVIHTGIKIRNSSMQRRRRLRVLGEGSDAAELG